MSMKTVQLGEIATFIRGITFKPDDVVPIGSPGSVACMRTKNVQVLLDESDVWSVDASLVKREDQFLQTGDILLSSANSWNLVGKCCWISERSLKTTFGGFISTLRGDLQKVDRRYLYHWFSSPETQHEVRHLGKQTTNISNLDLRRCERLEIPLPPLPEQKRIAAILDKADALRTKRRAALAKLDELTQSIFLGMFGDPVVNPRGWAQKPLRALTSKIGSGATPRGGEASYKSSGITLIRSMNIHDGLFIRDGLAFIDEDQAKRMNNVVVERGDVLLNITGASVARVCRVPNDALPARVNQHVAILRPIADIDSYFLEQHLLAPSVKSSLLQIAGMGATREAITKKEIQNFVVICPPIEIQKRFAAAVEIIEHLRAASTDHLENSDRLFASLQHRAFSGTL